MELRSNWKGQVLKVRGPKGQIERNVRFPQITTVVEGNDVIFSTESDRKSVIAMVGTFTAHAKNMCHGVASGFEYRMKVVYSHFPIQSSFRATGSRSTTSLVRRKPGMLQS